MGSDLDNDLTQIINKTALIENVLSQVIINYSSPRKDAYGYFWDVLLDNSVMSLGAKVKAVMAISHETNIKVNKNSLHKILEYRNAFAHHSLNDNPVFRVGIAENEGSMYYRLNILKSSGKVERINRLDVLEEFNKNYETALKSLVNINDAVKEQVKNNENTAT